MRLISIAVATVLLWSVVPASPEPACQSTQSVTLCKSRPGCAWVVSKNKKGAKCVPAKVAPR